MRAWTTVPEYSHSRTRINTLIPSTRGESLAASTSKKYLKGGQKSRTRIPDLKNKKLINDLFETVIPKSDKEKNSKGDRYGMKRENDGVVKTNDFPNG